jgi:hypothetical protein
MNKKKNINNKWNDDKESLHKEKNHLSQVEKMLWKWLPRKK